MIYIDRRTGSADLLPLLPPGGAVLDTLPFADALWEGSGPDGGRVIVAVERKKIRDLLQCLKDGRFTGFQLPGLVTLASYTYLVVEGITKACRQTGRLMLFEHGRWRVLDLGQDYWLYSTLEHHLETLRRKTPLRVITTHDAEHTADLITSLYTWWTVGGGWEGHKSHNQVHIPNDPVMSVTSEPVHVRTALKVAQQLPGIRDVLALRVRERFPTVRDMVAASPAQWAQVEGVGAVKAGRIWGAIHGPVVPVEFKHPRPLQSKPVGERKLKQPRGVNNDHR